MKWLIVTSICIQTFFSASLILIGTHLPIRKKMTLLQPFARWENRRFIIHIRSANFANVRQWMCHRNYTDENAFYRRKRKIFVGICLYVQTIQKLTLGIQRSLASTRFTVKISSIERFYFYGLLYIIIL